MCGGRAGVVLYEPLHGGSPEGGVTQGPDKQERCEGSPIAGVSGKKVPPQGFFEDHTGPAATHD
jgi:hypothetical protein